MESEKLKNYVKERYSKIAKTNQSCCFSPCCESSAKYISQTIGYSKKDLEAIPLESSLGLGCGNPVALASLKKGEIVLDLGSGAGIDVFLASKKVGNTGRVIGVDMTEEMIRRAENVAMERDYENVEFRLGEIEALPIEDESIDVVISNCVINLCPDKMKAFKEIFRVLKQNGRLMISDLVTKGELPQEVKKSFEAWADCISGALEKEKYLELIRNAGFSKVKVLSESPYVVDVSEELKGKILSISVGAFKKTIPEAHGLDL
jgi:ubiquinone/menaquinone biosynthesis C-methylase UbiE